MLAFHNETDFDPKFPRTGEQPRNVISTQLAVRDIQMMAPPGSVEADLLEYDKKIISLGKAFLFVTDLLKVQLEHFR